MKTQLQTFTMKRTMLTIIAFISVTSFAFAQEVASTGLSSLFGSSGSSSPGTKIVYTGKGAPVYLKANKDTTVKDTTPSVPFAFGDFTWLNGNDRRHSPQLDSKYVTGRVLLDANATYSFNNPIDHTVVGSTTLAQDDGVEINVAAIGGDFHDGNVRASLLLQLGTRSTVVPRNDYSGYKGQYDVQDAYRYFSEANAGDHFNVWHGINVDAGIFMSYIGLFSYYNCENWCYQPSFTSDNTPWFFNGIRIQTFPSDKLKIEYWIINGWQSYATFNNVPGYGFQVLYRPKEWISVLANGYYGHDDVDDPGRYRVHSDNSLEIRYLNQPTNKFISRCAFSVTQDVGWEHGDGVDGFVSSPTQGPAQYFLSGMVYNRIWFGKKQHIGLTLGGGYIDNPGRYLVLEPTGQASDLPTPVAVPTANGTILQTATAGTNPFTQNPGDQFTGWDCTAALDWMPAESYTFEIQIDNRHASVPYFAGPGGVTSPDGYITTPIPAGWTPDLVKQETRIIIAFMARF